MKKFILLSILLTLSSCYLPDYHITPVNRFPVRVNRANYVCLYQHGIVYPICSPVNRLGITNTLWRGMTPYWNSPPQRTVRPPRRVEPRGEAQPRREGVVTPRGYRQNDTGETTTRREARRKIKP